MRYEKVEERKGGSDSMFNLQGSRFDSILEQSQNARVGRKTEVLLAMLKSKERRGRILVGIPISSCRAHVRQG